MIEPIRDHWVIVGALVILIVALVTWWRASR
jgi:hypothetical protein